MKLDILAFAAHPDDTELSCAGTLASHVAQGKKVGVVDLTQGELGTRGTPETRRKEAAESAEIIGLSVRDNLKMADGFFKNDKEHKLQIIKKIRQYQPDVLLANAISDRHPDHGRASELVKEAVFYSGLRMIETEDEEGNAQTPWRPRLVMHYIQSMPIVPDILVDVSDHWETKMKAVRAFKSQFFDPNSKEPETYISSEGFMKSVEARSIEFGQIIGVKYAEGFTLDRYTGVKDVTQLL
jgi:bacillithiol biosynthesis deacetylase BshB1